jgi:hypothetical protein
MRKSHQSSTTTYTDNIIVIRHVHDTQHKINIEMLLIFL